MIRATQKYPNILSENPREAARQRARIDRADPSCPDCGGFGYGYVPTLWGGMWGFCLCTRRPPVDEEAEQARMG